MLFPRVVNFSESDSIKSVCFKIFKEFRTTLRRAIHSQITALRGHQDNKQSYDIFQDGLDDSVIKNVFEESFIDRRKTANGVLVPLPYEVYVIDK